MPDNPTKTAERRIGASCRARACAAGLCVGAQLFLAGCAVGMPLALGSAWIAALPALPLSAWITSRCHRALQQTEMYSRPVYTLLAVSLLLCSAFALAAMVSFAAQTLAEQARGAWTAALALAAAALCVLAGGTGTARLCFALRYAFPLLLLGLSALGIPLRTPAGLFPLLGAGGTELCAAAACMLFGAAPALMLALPPPELRQAGKDPQPCSIPELGFFLRRVLPGALAGTALLFLGSACTTYESIAEGTQWGARLRMAAGNLAREGIAQMLLSCIKLLAMQLLAANTLCAAEQALALAFPALGRGRAGLALLLALDFAILAALILLGEGPLLAAAPGIAAPALLAAWLLGRRKRA